MSRKKIEKPKVFISYAWANKEYEDTVLSFAQRLMQDGIDVIFDKWDLSEGNDTYAFMEKCVNDESITNVLILLDPTYAKKANEHIGGVGTETQIISAEVYKQVDQSKFIPILMKRDEEGNVHKPTYLEGRLHFDLSIEEEYDFTYKRLVKTLYGEEVYKKPELGLKPSWVEEKINVSSKILNTYDSLTSKIPNEIKADRFKDFLNNITNTIIELNIDFKEKADFKEYIDGYSKTKESRSEYLELLKRSIYIDKAYIEVAEFFENLYCEINKTSGYKFEILNIFIHELFIYTIAFLLKKENYIAVGYILGKTYFNSKYSKMEADSFLMFYSSNFRNNLDQAMCNIDNKEYYSGTAAYWISNIDIDFCNIDDFVYADIICFNYSIYGKYYISSWKWFPITYVYGKENNNKIEKISKKLVSKETINKLLPLFGYDKESDLINRINEIEKDKESIVGEYHYYMYFYRAPIISDYIKANEIARLK